VSPGRKKNPGRYHHGDLKAALVELAAQVAAREGVDAIQMVELARAAGVSGAAPFRHFPTRQALLVAVAEEAGRRVVERMDRAAHAVADPLQAQRARGVAYVRFAVEEPGYFRVLTRPEILQASETLRGLDAASEASMEPVLGRYQAGQASPELVQRSAGLLAAQALTFGLARMIVDGLLGPVSADEAERLAWEVTGVLGEGLGGTGKG
jgi:AcrR family transcriptional regulator